jgi:actin related protein 2/3 complex subunit 1A/1B
VSEGAFLELKPIHFSPKGHDSTITIVYPNPEEPSSPASTQTIRTPSLPYVTLLFLSPTLLLAAGHDCQPHLYAGSASEQWTFSKSLDDPTASAAGSGNKAAILQPTGGGGGVGRLNSEAFRTFRSADSRGNSGGGSSGGPAGPGGAAGSLQGGELGTIHQNTITRIKAFEVGQSGEVTKVSTSGVDGRLVIWNVGGAGGGAGIAGRMGRMGI